MLPKWMRCLANPMSISLLTTASLISYAYGDGKPPCPPPPTCPPPLAPSDLKPTTPEMAAPPTVPLDITELARVTDGQSRAPYMIGDFFGPFSNSGVRFGGPGANAVGFLNLTGGGLHLPIVFPITVTTPSSPATFQSSAFSQPFTSVTPASAITTGTVVALQPNPSVTLPPGATLILSEAIPSLPSLLINQVPGQAGVQYQRLTPAQAQALGLPVPNNLLAILANFGPQSQALGPFPGSVPGMNVPGPGGAVATGAEYVILDVVSGGAVAAGGLFIFAPQPGDAIGGYKISDNNSPMPRDRVYVVYNHFDDTFGPTDINLGRFGVEKTFLNGLFSVELRIPFAGTVDSTQPSDGNIFQSSQFGNVVVNLKALLYGCDPWLFSGGLGISTPTANDTRVTAGGTELVRITNESVHVLPFLAALWAPNSSRWFAQGFIQYDIDTNGNPVTIMGTPVGRVQNTNYLYLDVGAGFYAYENTCHDAWIRSIAPMLEFHYNLALDSGHNVTDPNGITVGSTLGSVNNLNLLLGGAIQIRDNVSLSGAWVLPLSDRNFNWEANCALNVRFGPTRIRSN